MDIQISQNNEIILILSYCDTELKQNILTNQLQYIKKNFPDIHTMHLSNYNLQGSYIKSLTTHYVYNSDNRFIDRSKKIFLTYRSLNHLGKNCNAINVQSDSAMPVFVQLNVSLNLLKVLGYQYIHIINYDSIVYGKNLSDLIAFNRQKFAEGYEFITNFNPVTHSVSLMQLGIRPYVWLDKLQQYTDETLYLEDIQLFGEQYLYKKILESDIKIFLKDGNNMGDLYSSLFHQVFDFICKFIWIGWDYTENKACIFISGYSEPIKSVVLQIESDEYVVIENTIENSIDIFSYLEGKPRFLFLKSINNKIYNTLITDNITDNFWKDNIIDYNK